MTYQYLHKICYTYTPYPCTLFTKPQPQLTALFSFTVVRIGSALYVLSLDLVKGNIFLNFFVSVTSNFSVANDSVKANSSHLYKALIAKVEIHFYWVHDEKVLTGDVAIKEGIFGDLQSRMRQKITTDAVEAVFESMSCYRTLVVARALH